MFGVRCFAMALLLSACQSEAHASCSLRADVRAGCLLAIGDKVLTSGSVELSVSEDGLFADDMLVMRLSANTVFVDDRLVAQRDQIPLYLRLKANGNDEAASIEECARARRYADERVAAALASLVNRGGFEAVRNELMMDARIAEVVQAIAWPEGEVSPRWKLFGDSWGEVAIGDDTAGPSVESEMETWCSTLAEIAAYLRNPSKRHVGVVVVGGDVVFFGGEDFASLMTEAQKVIALGRTAAASKSGYRIWRESR